MAPGEDILLPDATPDDVAALAALHVRTFRETHGDGPDVSLRQRQWQAKFASGQLVFCIVLENAASQLIGFASGQVHKRRPTRVPR